MKKTLLLFVFALVAATGYAKEGMCDFIHFVDNIYYQYIDGQAWVSRCAHYGYEDEVIWENNNYSGNLVIPESVEGYTVVGILSGAFTSCTELTSISFPSTIKTIGEDAFYNLTALTELTIPATIESIGDGAFKYSGLKKLTIADSDKPLKMGKGGTGNESMFSFQKVASLGEVYIGRPIEITDGDKDLFYSCNIKKVTLGSAVTEITDGWFSGCDQLQQFTATDNLKRIGERCFKNCKVLTDFTAGGLEEIGKEALCGCEKLNTLTCANIKTIGDEAFYSCSTIEWWNFTHCPLETIGKDAFCYNSSLKKLSLPATLKSIGDDGFYSCEALESITCLATIPPTCGNWKVFRYLDTNKCKLIVPEGSVDAYKAADVWKDFFNIEATGIKQVSVNEDDAAQWYDLNGQRQAQPRKGIVIKRQANGKISKVIVK